MSGDNSDRILYALAYPIGLIALILVLTKKEDRDARYHGYNGLFLAIAFMILGTICGVIPIIGWIAGALLTPAYLIYSIMLAIKVNNGEYPVIPKITDFAAKYVEGE